MSNNNLSDLVSQTQAAEIRGVTREAIADLVRRGKLNTIEVAGRKLLKRSDVENYTPETGGRPKKAEGEGETSGPVPTPALLSETKTPTKKGTPAAATKSKTKAATKVGSKAKAKSVKKGTPQKA